MKIKALSGFPEWLPEQRIVEQAVIATIQRQFELFGFAPIETRAVEPLQFLTSKGATDKEIYVLRRINATADEGNKSVGLHFDLTVPFARYVAQHRGQLDFPFKRYQIQKVWRGERPQKGRFREFYQADIDVIGQETLPLHHDAEMVRVLYSVMSALPVPPVCIHINNRKVLEGAYRALGIEDIAGVLRVVDKLDKMGEAKVHVELGNLGLSEATANTILELGRIRGTDASVVETIRALGLEHPLLDEGLSELAFVLNACADLPTGSVEADLHIARGLDYYTGTVYEGTLEGLESLGSVCSGGRYENLAAMGGKAKLPGVGVSIGVSRLLSTAFAEGTLTASRKTPTAVLIALDDADRHTEAVQVATALRARDIACEVFDKPAKYGKQIQYADKKGIPFVWFCGRDGATDTVKDIRSGEQSDASADTWQVPEADRSARIVRQ
jgi:histidyl-tRNA synthetase